MKLYKNGYRSERQDSLATAVKLLTFIFGLRVVNVAVCAYAIFSGCGSGGSGNEEPVYDENDRCMNCENDATISGGGDSTTPTGCQNDDECSDGIDCTTDACLADGTCVNMPSNKNCVESEICDSTKGGCVKAKSCFNDEQCADEWDCTVEGCDQETNLCFPSIEDDTRCGADEICKPNHPVSESSGCVAGQACKNDSECPTKDFCVVGACKLGICEWTPDNNKCDDGIWCNGFETCRPDICPYDEACKEGCYPSFLMCDPVDSCASCSCDEETNELALEPHDELCDDDDLCTIDVCDFYQGCKHKPNEECGG